MNTSRCLIICCLMVLVLLNLMVGTCIAGTKAPAGVAGYKIYYKTTARDKTVFGDDVEVEKIVDSGYTLTSLTSGIKGRYGAKVSLNEDHSFDNFSKLFLQPHEQKIMAKVLSNEIRMLVKTKIDFRKFDNAADLSKIFDACYETAGFTCDKTKRACSYDTLYSKRVTCHQKGHIFDDLSSKANDAYIGIVINDKLVEGVMANDSDKWFMFLFVRQNEPPDEEDGGIRQAEVINQIQSLLPVTKLYPVGATKVEQRYGREVAEGMGDLLE